MKKQLEYLTHIFRKITARLKNTDYQALFLKLKSRVFWQKVYELLKSFRQKYLVDTHKQTLYVALGLIYLFYLIFPTPPSLFTKTKLQIYGNNNSPVLHTVLADSYLGVYDYTAARKELGLAMASQPSQEIEKKLALVSVWETRPETLNKDLVSWQKITKEKPDFRDGFFQEALILYQLKRLDEAKIVLEKVFFLDPNFESGRLLEKELL